jgi:hypothetical protein
MFMRSGFLGDVIVQRRDVASLALNAEPLEHAAQPVCELSEQLKLVLRHCTCGYRFRFETFAFDGKHRGTPCQLALALTESDAAKVAHYFGEYVGEAPRCD